MLIFLFFGCIRTVKLHLEVHTFLMLTWNQPHLSNNLPLLFLLKSQPVFKIIRMRIGKLWTNNTKRRLYERYSYVDNKKLGCLCKRFKIINGKQHKAILAELGFYLLPEWNNSPAKHIFSQLHSANFILID